MGIVIFQHDVVAISPFVNKMFIPVYKNSHKARLNRIKALSPKQYLDDGPMALYLAVYAMHAKGFNLNVETCLVELEKLYNLPPLEDLGEPTKV